MSDISPAQQWRRDLEKWAIPEEILSQAEESPWIHPTVLFDVPEVIVDSPSHQRGREVLGDDGSVLDVGCGGGIAAFALTPPATSVMGVDHQSQMLAMFETNAAHRSLDCQTFEGFWPAVAGDVPRADVVATHHVVYNVADIVPFVRALHEHATRRVVIEMPQRHPLASLSDAWKYFWELDRPTSPQPELLFEVVSDMGLRPEMDLWHGPGRGEPDLAQAAHFTRIRLCLPARREGEVYDYLAARPSNEERQLATLWWDA